MAKAKNKKRVSAENVSHKKKTQGIKKMNPFEVHINKQKMRILGQQQKNDRGLPGISRSKALKKRGHTLLQEYKVQNKSNRFIDKRIGENMGEDERSVARFTAMRRKAHARKSVFNLADDEVLTHRGQTLTEIEKFDDPRSDDEDDAEDTGRLGSDFVGDAHFGGGILSKAGSDGAMSHRDLIDKLITESKKRKAEKQKTREKTLELTEKLDTEWKDLIPIVSSSVKNAKEQEDTSATTAESDDYDKVMQGLRFEARGQPSDRLKTEYELAKEEKEKLEQMEKDRLERMKGTFSWTKQEAASKHRSADDLEDGFAYDPDPEVTLSYNDQGEANIPIVTTEQTEQSEEKDKADFSEEGEEEDEADSEDDDLSDLKDSSESEDNENDSDQSEKEFESNDNKSDQKADKILADLMVRKEMMEKARKELPYTFPLPDSYEELEEILKNQPPSYKSVIIERIIKCNHPSLVESNKEKLSFLFVYLLQYLNDQSSDSSEESIKESFETFKCMLQQLFDLAQLNKEGVFKAMLELVKEKQQECSGSTKSYPGLDVLLFLKLVSCLFPTSDFRHQVVTPCVVFLDQLLCRLILRSKRDIAYGLFLVTLVLEYTMLSKRFLPSTLNFLVAILYGSIPKSANAKIPIHYSKLANLVVYKNCSSMDIPSTMEASDLLRSPSIDEEFKIRSLAATLKLISELHDRCKDLPSGNELFEPILDCLKQIPTGNYPVRVKDEIDGLLTTISISRNETKLEYIVMETKRPKALRLYEPNIVKVLVYDKRHKTMSKEKAEREKLLHKLKREKKGALREIRRDGAFLGRVKISQQIQSDKERSEKVKRIYAEASMQQGELNSLDRKKQKRN